MATATFASLVSFSNRASRDMKLSSGNRRWRNSNGRTAMMAGVRRRTFARYFSESTSLSRQRKSFWRARLMSAGNSISSPALLAPLIDDVCRNNILTFSSGPGANGRTNAVVICHFRLISLYQCAGVESGILLKGKCLHGHPARFCEDKPSFGFG